MPSGALPFLMPSKIDASAAAAKSPAPAYTEMFLGIPIFTNIITVPAMPAAAVNTAGIMRHRLLIFERSLSSNAFLPALAFSSLRACILSRYEKQSATSIFIMFLKSSHTNSFVKILLDFDSIWFLLFFSLSTLLAIPDFLASASMLNFSACGTSSLSILIFSFSPLYWSIISSRSFSLFSLSCFSLLFCFISCSRFSICIFISLGRDS